ncbi:sugar porter family MFS transporter [Labilibaculum sp. DW002]|uniref:Sugar porter family MFS transporter n=1 Tax=Paralabilibaculum antarcticum TaxID=2912572 RepID=A0ABT5VRP0_9BACT|nr:sugar porter family MFS transporter [Labilibaculum sp. DW002]MDE5418102.1 sugar porter family MFS transporter [Labilibaculum sp. DW002]
MKKRNTYVFTCALIAALGGLLFGFDTAVISGAEKSIQEMFGLDGFWHGFTVAIALIGTIVGAMTAGKPADKFGRKKVLLVIAAIYGITALVTAMTSDWTIFVTFRFIGGIGVGASSVIGPMYIAEIAPAHLRGRLVGMFQLNVVSGILLAFFSNYLISSIVETESWRWMLGVQAIPSAIFFFLLFYIPASPRLLVLKGKSVEALGLLKRLASLNPEKELKEIEESMIEDSNSGNANLFSKAYRFPVLLAILIAIFNQLSGINAIMYYAPRIFEMTGFGKDDALLQSVVIGATNFIFTLLAMTVIDKIGRKKLLLIGSTGMVFFLGLVAKTLFEGSTANILVVAYLVGFIACFAFSQGAVIWVFISEIFPNKVRAKGQALGSFTHWIMAAMVSWMFPAIAESGVNGGGVAFTIFSVAMMVQLIVVFKFFPETKGKSLEQIQKELKRA